MRTKFAFSLAGYKFLYLCGDSIFVTCDDAPLDPRETREFSAIYVIIFSDAERRFVADVS